MKALPARGVATTLLTRAPDIVLPISSSVGSEGNSYANHYLIRTFRPGHPVFSVRSGQLPGNGTQKTQKTTTRRAGPKVWLAAILTVGALLAFRDDNPIFWRPFLDVVSEFVLDRPITLMLGGGGRVIDGDTLDVDGKRVRLHGIDAPESGQTCRRRLRMWECGVEATRALERLIGISAVTCEKRATDRYGRMVATCDAGGRNLNARMVRQGYAVAYYQHGGGAYAADEAIARARRAGIWSGRFVAPADWRKRRR